MAAGVNFLTCILRKDYNTNDYDIWWLGCATAQLILFCQFVDISGRGGTLVGAGPGTTE